MSIPVSRHIDRQPYLNMLDRPERSASFLVFIDLAQTDGNIYKAVNGISGMLDAVLMGADPIFKEPASNSAPCK